MEEAVKNRPTEKGTTDCFPRLDGPRVSYRGPLMGRCLPSFRFPQYLQDRLGSGVAFLHMFECIAIECFCLLIGHGVASVSSVIQFLEVDFRVVGGILL
jgi:hypothetical protein